jgi:DNA-binding SARP family transcriptional activator
VARLAIHVFGPLEIKLDGKPMPSLESDKVRALLVFLAVVGARPHRREKLAALLWPDWPERAARANLRRALANLRKALNDSDAVQPFLFITWQTIQFNRDSDVWVDANAFADLLSSGSLRNRPHDVPTDLQTIRRLEDAVELYRGEFLEGFSLADCADFDEWAMFEQEQIHRQIMDTLCHLCGWYEDRGEWKQALHYAWRQLELDPWRETAHRQVIRLLAHSGQRSAALVQYRVCCQELKEELGVKPEVETVQLYERIRDGMSAPPTALPDAVWHPSCTPKLPAFLVEDEEERHIRPVFVARERELERLDLLLEKAIDGQGQIVFVVGGPGRGKTALLGEFARRAMYIHPNLLVARGTCSAYSGVGDPYLPFRDILSLLTGDVKAQWKAGTISQEHARRLWSALPLSTQLLLKHGPQVIRTLMSGAALMSRAIAAAPAGTQWLRQLKEHVERQECQAERAVQIHLFQQVFDVFHYLAEAHPLLLILDDLQWIDTASTCLLFHLGRRMVGSRILVAGAYRSDELGPGHFGASPMQPVSEEQQHHPLERVVGEFKRRFGDVWMDLAAVSESEARQFVDAFLDAESNRLGDEFRESLLKRAGGHPLFTIEILRAMRGRGDLRLDEEGYWIEGPALDWQTLPARIEGAIEERVTRLGDDLREILTVASVEGEEFHVAVPARVLGLDQRQLMHKLSVELEKRYRLVRERKMQTMGPNCLIRFRFAHALFRQYLYNQLGEGERMLLHLQIASIVEELYKRNTQETAVQLSYHFAGDPERERY